MQSELQEFPNSSNSFLQLFPPSQPNLTNMSSTVFLLFSKKIEASTSVYWMAMTSRDDATMYLITTKNTPFQLSSYHPCKHMSIQLTSRKRRIGINNVCLRLFEIWERDGRFGTFRRLPGSLRVLDPRFLMNLVFYKHLQVLFSCPNFLVMEANCVVHQMVLEVIGSEHQLEGERGRV